MLRKVLIANRGEIALRVMRACRELGIPAVVAYSEGRPRFAAGAAGGRGGLYRAAAGAPQLPQHPGNHQRGARSPARTPSIPATGFCPRTRISPRSAPQVGLTFIGPSSGRDDAHGRQGAGADADEAKPACRCCPAAEEPIDERRRGASAPRRSATRSSSRRRRAAAGAGCASSVTDRELADALPIAQAEARSGFWQRRVYIEKYLERPRHIEVQIIADGTGTSSHLGERDCSLQRRHQKADRGSARARH